MHYNISKTLQYASHVRELPDQAREAEMMLTDDAQLLQVYEMLSILECTSIKTKMALEAGAKASVSQSSALSEYFQQVGCVKGVEGCERGGIWGRCIDWGVCILSSAPSIYLHSTCTPPISLCIHLQVQASIARFEERLWYIIRNFMTVSQEQQWLLTDAVRIIETQEKVDQHIQAAIQGRWVFVCVVNVWCVVVCVCVCFVFCVVCVWFVCGVVCACV